MHTKTIPVVSIRQNQQAGGKPHGLTSAVHDGKREPAEK